MLFNSYAFLFVFLPVVILGYQIAGRFHRRAVVGWLGFASLAFYAYWRPSFLLVLLASMATNYLAAIQISRAAPDSFRSRLWLWSAIGVNLAALGYFKYLFSLLNLFSHAAGTAYHWGNVVLPLGISFFTFTQIAYLVDLQQGVAKLQDIWSYILFVTFFPHLIAGPILHHKEMMPQFTQERKYQLRSDDFAVGVSWFIMGLGKKVLLADHFAVTASAAFSSPQALPTILAWRGAISYSLQLYFDFSGYSDMALGLARMFSIEFPINFSSPYKAKNIIEFWQRWHITLTRYITAYLYSPLQFWVTRRRQEQGKKVSRKALATPEGFANMIMFPTLTTMLIAGVWHGAGLQYIVFGGLHGVYITVNHAWMTLFPKKDGEVRRGSLIEAALAAGYVLLTCLCALVANVFFRAANCSQARSILAAMLGAHGLRAHSFFAGESTVKVAIDLSSMAAGLIIVWALPNTQQILSRFHPGLELSLWDTEPSLHSLWSPSIGWAVVLSGIFLLALINLQDPSTFLYFQF